MQTHKYQLPQTAGMSDLLICVGHHPGELLPIGPPVEVQTRILSYLESSKSSNIKVHDAYEVRPAIEEIVEPFSAEIIGAWYNACVFHAARIVLEKGGFARINPDLTLSMLEVFGTVKDGSSFKRSWLEEYLQEEGYPPDNIGDYLHCSPHDPHK